MTARRSFLALGKVSAAILAFTAVMLAEGGEPGDARRAQISDPLRQANNSWVSIEGQAHDISGNTFVLNYIRGEVVVELDDHDPDREASYLREGDVVTVIGAIDCDPSEELTIEATSVYIQALALYVYASAIDEEDSGTGSDSAAKTPQPTSCIQL
jgi:uncharacterized protein YdeI (BOF family)